MVSVLKRIPSQLLTLLVAISFLTCKDSRNNQTAAQQAIATPEVPLFERISAEQSQVLFKNKITEDLSTLENLFDFDYFYNGAGVGLEDLNNDGLLDIFFCGNQAPNKLYLNKGDWIFEDISEKAGINQGKIWSNGVSFVDINNDGWMDIYISQGGPNKRLQRKNLLYINKKNNTFEESAEQYGLADMGISTQSAFFDFDQDGDLDCLVMNENEYYGVNPIALQKLVAQDEVSKHFNSSHLYRNDNGTYKDITRQSGIERPIFGLGLAVSDINNDGWLDFYMASDYYLPDVLFINNKNGTFTDEIKTYTNQISYYGMGMDIADINNDQLQDIFVLDMAANNHVRSKTLMASMNTNRFNYLVNTADFHHQYMYNSLQMNTGVQKFSNVAQATAMANTDWSWSVLLSDFDHDTDKDIYITNGYRKYALDNDLQRQVSNAKRKYPNGVPLNVKKGLYEAMPSEKLPNILFENQGALSFKESAHQWGLDAPTFSNGAAIGDLDNDGDLDIVLNNMDENCFLYQNKAVETQMGNYLTVKPIGLLSESFPKITIHYGANSQFIETRRIRGYRSSQEHIAHFGLGTTTTVDSLSVVWPSGKIERKYNLQVNTKLIIKEEDAKEFRLPALPIDPLFVFADSKTLGVDFIHKENPYNDFEKEVLLPYQQSTQGPFITKGDINGDGLQDFFIGGATGQPGKLYVQDQNGQFKAQRSKALEYDHQHEDMGAVFFDFDNDSDLDLYVVSGGNEYPS
ncbi:MAG: VCBS repeat-containing protein, partial [Bacteroidota bacterium]